MRFILQLFENILKNLKLVLDELKNVWYHYYKVRNNQILKKVGKNYGRNYRKKY